MKIGIVTTWFERGAAYVSKIYKQLLEQEGHKVYIYSRGGENVESKGNSEWIGDYVTYDRHYEGTRVCYRTFAKWIKKNSIEVVLFNEQQDFRILATIKKRLPKLKIGAYVDYYTENTIPWFNIYDFLICNTQRHMQAMKDHPQKFYVKWGTDIDLYLPAERKNNQKLIFFHSVGMSPRKGTDILIDAFINGECYKDSKLIVHTQIPIERVCKYTADELTKYNIDVIEKTVTAPGLYYLGDVYVYPTRLDGLGLTMYEALSSGLPVITTDFPPMNEIINNEIGKLVKVKDFYCRGDAYFYPMSVCDEQSLVESMRWYIDNKSSINMYKRDARAYAEKNLNLYDRARKISAIFEGSEVRKVDRRLINLIENFYGIESLDIYKAMIDNKKIYKLMKRIKNIVKKGK